MGGAGREFSGVSTCRIHRHLTRQMTTQTSRTRGANLNPCALCRRATPKPGPANDRADGFTYSPAQLLRLVGRFGHCACPRLRWRVPSSCPVMPEEWHGYSVYEIIQCELPPEIVAAPRPLDEARRQIQNTAAKVSEGRPGRALPKADGTFRNDCVWLSHKNVEEQIR